MLQVNTVRGVPKSVGGSISAAQLLRFVLDMFVALLGYGTDLSKSIGAYPGTARSSARRCREGVATPLPLQVLQVRGFRVIACL